MSRATTRSVGGESGVPRAFVWLGITVLIVLAVMVWDRTLRPIATEWSFDADAIETNVRRVRRTEDMAQRLRHHGMRETVASVGAVEIPPSKGAGANRLNELVAGLMQEHGVSSDSFVQRPDSRLRKGALPELTTDRKRVERLRGDLTFESRAEDATAIIAALESDPVVQSLPSVRINTIGSGRVKVRLVLEAWVLADDDE